MEDTTQQIAGREVLFLMSREAAINTQRSDRTAVSTSIWKQLLSRGGPRQPLQDLHESLAAAGSQFSVVVPPLVKLELAFVVSRRASYVLKTDWKLKAGNGHGPPPFA